MSDENLTYRVEGKPERDCKVCTALTTLMDISVEAYEYASHGGCCESFKEEMS